MVYCERQALAYLFTKIFRSMIVFDLVPSFAHVPFGAHVSNGASNNARVHYGRKLFSTPVLTFVIAIIFATFAIGTNNSLLASETCCTNPGDEFWLVSARNIDECQTDVTCDQLECFRNIDGRWCPANFHDLTELHAIDSTKETVLHVHGTRTDFNDARRQCSTVYQNVFANCSARPPVRFVCWIWRSESETRRPVQEYKSKSRRSVLLGNIFAKTLRCFGQRPPVLIGYSLGTQLIASAITDPSATDLPCYRFAVIAPVLDCDFCKEPQIPTFTQQMVLFSSSKDRAVRFSKRICQKQCAPSFEQWASGPTQPLGPFSRIDVSAEVGKKHSINRYTSAAPVVACLNKMLVDNANQHAVQSGHAVEFVAPAAAMAEPLWSEPTQITPDFSEPALIGPE